VDARATGRHQNLPYGIPATQGRTSHRSFGSGQWLVGLLPLLQFLREAAGPELYQLPPLRAGFIIDDPNLHWPSYGFANYRDIAANARRENYHVAFATIPLDAWFIHRGSAEIFRANSPWLSLLVHGNNHAKDELAQPYSPQARSNLLQQVISRIESIEAKTQLRVCRVMVPPHGACSSHMLAQLPAHGFESACISAGSLRAHNPGRPWIHSLGLAPAELVEGCPVLPRWAFRGTTDSTLLAYLGQPLILRGHHQDLKDGLDLFSSFARSINALGPVRWGNLSDLSRLNYQWRLDGSLLRVKPLGTTMRIRVPAGAIELIVESGKRVGVGTESVESAQGDPGLVVPVQGGQEVIITRLFGGPEASRSQPPRTSARLILRRIATEARDRLRVT
jgi:hypothetical protein